MHKFARIILLVALLALPAVSAQASLVGGYFINFQPELQGEQPVEVPEGYVPDYGHAFGDQGPSWMPGLYGTYGWLDVNGPVDNTAQARLREMHADLRFDTLNHMQLNGMFYSWQIQLDNGLYNIELGCGDPQYGSTNDLLIEGLAVTDTKGGDDTIVYSLSDVEVTDGYLTLSPIDGAGAKLSYIHITPVPAPASMVVLGLGGLGVLLRRRR